MGAKVKMKCPRCHKMFKPTNPRQNLCDECATKDRAARVSAKAAPVKSAPQAPKAVAPLKISGPGANILVPGMAPSATDAPPPELGPLGAVARRQDRQEEATRRNAQQEQRAGLARPPQPGETTRPTPQGGPPQLQRPPQAQAPQEARGAKEAREHRDAHGPRPQRPPRPPKEPRPVPQPFQLTDDLRERVEARYLELAQPVEFDGIRTQIAAELSIPKAAVKKAIAGLLKRKQLPSWWELQASTSSPEELERIRTAYTPLLPTPPIGVHKQLATELGMDARQVYQGIRRIRAELRLPQYNPPEAHPEEPLAAPAPAEAQAAQV